MDEIVKTTLLEYEKSTFLLDLVKHDNGTLYVSIRQTIQIQENEVEVHKIKINPTVLDGIIEVLKNYKSSLPKDKEKTENYISTDQIQEIIKRYLKGSIEIKHLAIQFDCSEQIIKQILNNHNISIVSNKVPKKKYFWRRKSK